MRERVSAEDAALGIESLWHDVRGALRVFVKSPGFSLVVVATLALGIGANTAIFELLDAVRLRSLPIAKPNELAELRIAGGNHGLGITDSQYANFTVPMWQEVKEHHDPFSGIFAWRTADVQVGNSNQSRHVNGLEVSGDFFSVLGVVPLQGRLIEPQDETDCQISRVVASYSFWKSQMGVSRSPPTRRSSPKEDRYRFLVLRPLPSSALSWVIASSLPIPRVPLLIRVENSSTTP
jgi:hypothetical protein